MGALPKPALSAGPGRVLSDALHELHRRAGWPSLREMASEVGCSHTTVSVAFSEPRLPRWGLLELIVETLAGDTDEFHQLWLAASAQAASGTVQAAPSAVVTSAPRDLPADVVGFTGRVDQLTELDDLLARFERGASAVLIAELSGTAGVGKTALAVHWAHRVAEHFPDGQLYVNLRGYDPGKPLRPEEVLEAFLRELGVEGSAVPRDIAQRASRYRTLLSDRRMLVLLDNANSVDQIRDLLPGTKSCFVIVTSRDTLPGLVARHGAHRLDLDLLSITDATTLLRTLVGSRVDADADAARALANRCARLPLALRIAAELATSRPAVTLAELVGELEDEPGRLDLFAAGEDEYTAVRAVFSWSYRQLDADAARAFRLLGLHPGDDIDVHAAGALLGADPPAARRLLDSLARAHLVDARTRARFSMHDLLRAYAAELAAGLAEADRREALTGLLDHYLGTATRLVESSDARTWLDAERANLVAIAAVAAKGWPSHSVGLAAVLSRYLDARAYYTEALTLDQLALGAARDAGDRASEGTMLNLLAGVLRRLGRYADALELHEQALVIHRELGDRSGEGLALHGLGLVSFRSGRYAEAHDSLERALGIFREVGDRVSEGRALYMLGVVDLKLGLHADALRHEQQALQINREIGERTFEGRSLNNLGEVYLRVGRYAEAADQYRQALDVAREIGNRAGEGVALANLATVHERLAEDAEALQLYRQALVVCNEANYHIGQADALRGIGVVYSRYGRHDEAIDQLRQAVRIARTVGEADVQTASLHDLGDALRVAGRTSDALAAYRSVLHLAEQTGDRYEQARAHDGLARVQNDPVEVRAHRQQALLHYSDLGLAQADEIRARMADLDEVPPAPIP